jgi:carboxypeptidase family protein/TonB-dependent receptor-like protein
VQRLGVALTTLLVALAGAQPAGAQHLRGRLLDLESNEPLVAGFVTLMGANGTTLVTALSDREGSWVLAVPGPGSYYVAAKRVGYRPWVAGPLNVKAGDELSSVFHLERVPVTLDPVEVRAQATKRFLELAGFYDRQRADFGHYITPEDIDKRHAARITDLLSGLPGVTIVAPTKGSVGPLSIQLRGSNLSEGGLCRPRIFVDGLLYARGDARPKRRDNAQAIERSIEDEIQRLDQGLSIDDIGHPSIIAAIEVYRSATQVPVQFGGTSVETLCGVIVVWTRTGKPTTRLPGDSLPS